LNLYPWDQKSLLFWTTIRQQNKVIAIPAIILAYPVDIFYGSMDWDNQFSTHITTAEKYYFDPSGNLNISCHNDITLTFVKQT
jgi:hypothetical protein